MGNEKDYMRNQTSHPHKPQPGSMRNERESDMGTQAWAHRVVAFHSVSEFPIKTAPPSKLLNDWVGTYI